MNYWVIHKNPRYTVIDWIVDVPFSEDKAEQEIIRCEYKEHKIEHRIVSDDELYEIGAQRRPASKKKPTPVFKTPDNE